MNTTYKQVLNRIAYNQLTTADDMRNPDYHLAIGAGESLEAVPIYIFTDFSAPAQTAATLPYQELTYEDTTDNFSGQTLKQNDFPSSSFWLGLPTVGV